MQYNDAEIQLLDLPGIIEGAAQGKGRGRQVIAVARTSDLVIIMLDATKAEVHRQLLEAELESVGIRLNKQRPNIYFKVDYLAPRVSPVALLCSRCLHLPTRSEFWC